jgi:hypothetical protein
MDTKEQILDLLTRAQTLMENDATVQGEHYDFGTVTHSKVIDGIIAIRQQVELNVD